MSSLLHLVKVGVRSAVEVTEAAANVAVDLASEAQTFTKEGVHEFMDGVTAMTKSFRFNQNLDLQIDYTGKRQKKEYLKEGITEEEFEAALAATKNKLNIQ